MQRAEDEQMAHLKRVVREDGGRYRGQADSGRDVGGPTVVCGGDDATEEQEGEEDVGTGNDYREFMPVSTGMLLHAFPYKPGRVIAMLRHWETPDPQSGTTADVS